MPSEQNVEVEGSMANKISLTDKDYASLNNSLDSAIRDLVEVNKDTPTHMRDINVWAIMSEPAIQQLVATCTTIAAQALIQHMLTPQMGANEGTLTVKPSVYDLMLKLGLHGYITLSNVHMAMYMQEETMKYRVRYEIRLSNGFVFDDLTDNLYETLTELWERTRKWYELYFPDYLQNDEEIPVNI
jgi:hypothetical protein